MLTSSLQVKLFGNDEQDDSNKYSRVAEFDLVCVDADVDDDAKDDDKEFFLLVLLLPLLLEKHREADSGLLYNKS